MMECIHKYFPALTPDQFRKFEFLFDVYSHWNKKINIISRKDIQFFYERHVLHSLSIARFIQFLPGTNIVDIGTGGGFPGIPLAIIFPDVNFFLIDSIAKKIKIVDKAISYTELKNVKTIVSRAESLELKSDFVVSRAVTRLPEFCKIAVGLISRDSFNVIPNGIIYLKGGEFEAELRLLPFKAELTEIKNYFGEQYFLTKKIVYISVQ